MPIPSWSVARVSAETFRHAPDRRDPPELIARADTAFVVESRFQQHRFTAENEGQATWLADFLNQHCGLHPLLGTTPDWRVDVYSATVELHNQRRGLHAGFAKPNHTQSEEWWREQAAEAIRNARPY